jgi:hypothetical protein
MSELSEAARCLVEQGRRDDEPSAADKQRIRSRLAAELGAGAFLVGAMGAAAPQLGTSAAATSASSAAPVASARSAASTALRGAPGTSASTSASTLATRTHIALWRHGLVKLLLAAASAAAVYVGLAHLFASEGAAPRRGAPAGASAANVAGARATLPAPLPQRETAGLSAATEPSPAQPAPSDMHGVTSPAAGARASARLGTAVRAKKRTRETGLVAPSQPSERSDTESGRSQESALGAELALLAQAQRALREGAPDEALRLAREHARRFRDGALALERRGIEALAHCQRGHATDPSVASFLAQAGDSALAARVRKQCGRP